MTTKVAPLTDARLRQALVELAAGPDAGTVEADVLRAIDPRAQDRGLWAAIPPFESRWRLVGIAALLLLALVSALVIGAGFRESNLPGPGGPPAIVIQQWNGLEAGASRVAHVGFAPGAAAGTLVSARLPANAVGLRWSPGGQRLAYFAAEDRPGHLSRHGLAITGFFVARADGADPVAVRLPRSLDQYNVVAGWDGSAKWAPRGGLFAVPWSTHECSDGPNCLPPSGIDVFDAAGNLVKTINIVDADFGEAIWSPDGLALGWLIGSCADSYCSVDGFQWQRVDDDAPVITLPLDNGRIVWSADGLLHVVSVHIDPKTIGDATSFNETVGRVFTMRPDGTGLRELPWSTGHPELIPRWSPDGRLLATLDYKAGSLTIHDVQTGRDVVVSVPVDLGIAAWAPDSGRIVLFGGVEDNASAYAFYAVNADGTGLISSSADPATIRTAINQTPSVGVMLGMQQSERR